MKIGIVCYPTFGGSGVVATELGLALAEKGHKIHFITYQRPFRLTSFHENVFYHEVQALDYPLFEFTPYDTALASKLVDVITFESLDILHVHYAIPHASVAYLAKQILRTKGINIPVITTLHGTDITIVGENGSFAPVVEFGINQSDGVTAVSESLKRDTHARFNIQNEIRVIYNFIDFTRFKKRDKDHFKRVIAPNDEKVLAHVSNFRKVKRVEDVIRVFAKVLEKIPSKLILIGDGPERNSMEALGRKLGICNHIRYVGKQEAVEELLAIADLFLLPSEKESFGLSALEAMACAVPVISSDAGGLSEVNLDQKTGYVSPVGDVDSMAANAIRVLEDDLLHQKLSQQAVAHAKTFCLEQILPQYEAFYESVIKKTLNTEI